MSEPHVSVVVPVFNEEAVARELVTRCRDAATSTGRSWELIIVDDHSEDATADRLAEFADDPRVRHVRLPANVGQFRATRAGLKESRGEVVVVLDGDLQDPPELIADLVAAYDGAGDAQASVFATKSARHEGALFRVGRLGYAVLSSMAAWQIPSGSGAYCALPGPLARRIASVPAPWGNLAPFVAAGSDRLFLVPYEKAPRYDATSRVGGVGLITEALATLMFNGSAERLAYVVGFAFLALTRWPLGFAWVLAGLMMRRRRRRFERVLRAES